MFMEPKDIEKKEFSINMVLKHNAYLNKPLNFENAYLMGAFTMAAYNEDLREAFGLDRETILVQSVAALCSLHNRDLYKQANSGKQIAGICAAIFDYDISRSTYGFVDVPKDVMDNCGMGGDLFKTPNLSTIAALVVAADGVPMLKHGSPGNTDSTGSSDFLKYCGVELFSTPDKVQKGIADVNFAYTEALDTNYKQIHIQTHKFAHLAHMNDIIGPITNPVNPDRMVQRVIGVNHLIPPERVAEAYIIMNEYGVTNVKRGLFVRGFADKQRNGGIDEVSLMPGGTIVAELNDGKVSTYELFAKDFGLPECTPEDLNPGTNKAETSKQIVQGVIRDARRDTALANAAVLFNLDSGIPLLQAVKHAGELIDSGKPYAVLEAYAKISQVD